MASNTKMASEATAGKVVVNHWFKIISVLIR